MTDSKTTVPGRLLEKHDMEAANNTVTLPLLDEDMGLKPYDKLVSRHDAEAHAVLQAGEGDPPESTIARGIQLLATLRQIETKSNKGKSSKMTPGDVAAAVLETVDHQHQNQSTTTEVDQETGEILYRPLGEDPDADSTETDVEVLDSIGDQDMYEEGPEPASPVTPAVGNVFKTLNY